MSDELPYFFPRRRRLRAHTPEPKSRREKSEVAALGSVVDIETIKQQNVHYQKQLEALAQLDDCVAQKRLEPALTVLLDDGVRIEDRKKAAGLLAELNDVSCIEPVRNHVFKDPHLEQEVNLVIGRLLANNFLKECPYCAELIKARAVVCKHCQRELAT